MEKNYYIIEFQKNSLYLKNFDFKGTPFLTEFIRDAKITSNFTTAEKWLNKINNETNFDAEIIEIDEMDLRLK